MTGITTKDKYREELQSYDALRKAKLKTLESYEEEQRLRAKKLREEIMERPEYIACTNEKQRTAVIASALESNDLHIAKIERNMRAVDAEIDISCKLLSYWKRVMEMEIALILAQQTAYTKE
jgi:hypothetical protein